MTPSQWVGELDLDGVEFQVPHIVSADRTERRGALLSPCSLPSLTQSCRVWGTLQPGKGGSWPLLRGGGGATVVFVVFFISCLSWEAARVLVLLLREQSFIGALLLASTDFFFFWLPSDSCTQLGKYEAKGNSGRLLLCYFLGSQGPSQSAFSPRFRVFLTFICLIYNVQCFLVIVSRKNREEYICSIFLEKEVSKGF